MYSRRERFLPSNNIKFEGEGRWNVVRWINQNIVRSSSSFPSCLRCVWPCRILALLVRKWKKRVEYFKSPERKDSVYTAQLASGEQRHRENHRPGRTTQLDWLMWFLLFFIALNRVHCQPTNDPFQSSQSSHDARRISNYMQAFPRRILCTRSGWSTFSGRTSTQLVWSPSEHVKAVNRWRHCRDPFLYAMIRSNLPFLSWY